MKNNIGIKFMFSNIMTILSFCARWVTHHSVSQTQFAWRKVYLDSCGSVANELIVLSIIILWLVLWFHWQDIYWSSRRSNLLSYRPTRGSEVDLASLIDCFWRASGVMTSCRLLSHTFCTVWTSYLGSSDAKTRGMDSNLSYRIGIEYRGTLTRTQSLWKDFPVFTSRLLHLQTVWLL